MLADNFRFFKRGIVVYNYDQGISLVNVLILLEPSDQVLFVKVEMVHDNHDYVAG